ncbi:MAG: membrane protein insertase YidC [Betaproteobacteria bacterium]|nr:MAG: membrane protein insertase YidC [Betaproteobacteria bacterium]
MDTQRLILVVIFFFSVFMLFEAWQRESRPPPPTSSPAPGKEKPSEKASGEVPAGPSKKLDATVPGALSPSAEGLKPASGEIVNVYTDVLSVSIDTVGGSITRLELPRHRATVDTSKNFVLFERAAERTYVAQSGLIGEGLPNHNSRFVAAAREYKLADGQNRLEVRLDSSAEGGASVGKVFIFERSSYSIRIRHEVRTAAAETPAQIYGYYQLLRDGNPPEGDSKMLPTYTGVAVYTEQDKFQKVAFGDIDKGKAPYTKTTQDGWIGLVQHYFVSAWIAPRSTPREYYTKHLDNNLYTAGVILPFANAPQDGASLTQEITLYAGPQDQDRLAAIAPGLDLTVDYGWLTIIATPLFWVLKTLYGWVGNWGVAIIILTILIKLIFYPLSAASYRSMAKMRVLAPKMQRLKELHGDDRQRMQQAMMDLYKTEKINPLGGCLPILVQIPVFIALYWVLLASFELRQAPFVLWINDLAAPDPYYILPVLMGATMIIQTRLNPEPPDPVQAKIMKIMPIAFSIFFFFFPAGLVLYWLVNNILSIAQQWQITRSLERAAPVHGRR